MPVKQGNGIASIILCYCQRGTRSLKAASILREAGIDNVFSLEGGLEALAAKHSALLLEG